MVSLAYLMEITWEVGRILDKLETTPLRVEVSYAYLVEITWEVGRTLDKLETTPLRVMVSYAYLVFSQPPACLHQAM